MARRRVAYERLDPAGARRLFLRHALVAGEWDASHAFLEENRERVVDVLALEHRVRRDLLVTDDELVDFFDSRVPEHVTTGGRFERWWRRVRDSNPGLLTYPREVLVGGDAAALDADARFPEWVRIGTRDLPLTYVADEGAELDGVTVDLPLLLLDRIDGARLDWQVPGLRAELLTALVRSLPKASRRALGPVPEVVDHLLAEVGPVDGPLLEVLPRALGRLAGAPVAVHATDVAQLPDHLRVTYRVVDDQGRPIAWSRDLGALRRRMRRRLETLLAEHAPLDPMEDLRAWPAQGVPRSVEVRHGGLSATAHPALVDADGTVALRIFPSRAEQQVAMWAGTRRLLLLELGNPLRSLDRALSSATKLDLASSDRLTAADAYRSCVHAAIDHLMLSAGGPAWDGDGFAALLAAVRPQCTAVAATAAEVVGGIVATVARVDARLASMVSATLDETVLDVQAHLARLLHSGWIATAGIDRLPDVARYLRAVEHRLTKAAADPSRDRVRIARVREPELAYAPLASRDPTGEIRWMLEELRVATFAESVGARRGVSATKVMAAIAGLG